MRATIFQHVPFEGPALFADLLAGRQWTTSVIPLFDGAALLAIDSFDLLVMMGGPMSVNDESRFPWLVAEKALIRQAIAAGKSVVGVCLGAQLIASALGARVYPNPEKEIGWWPIQPVGRGEPAFPPDLMVFHWHGETFDLPGGAVHLARSEACRHQAFRIGTRVIGLQFHLETTPASAGLLIENARDELWPPTRFVQSEATLRSALRTYSNDCRNMLERVIDYVIAPEIPDQPEITP